MQNSKTKYEQRAARRKEELRQAKLAKTQRKLKAYEASIQKTYQRIKDDDYKEYHIKNSLNHVHFLPNIPTVCPVDGNELIYVQRVSFDMFGVKVKTQANCCIRCNSAYLPESKKPIFREKARKLKEDQKVSKPPVTNADNKQPEKQVPQEQAREPLPLEMLGSEIENISSKGKIVQVYVNKCHCQKCEAKYHRVTITNRTAVVDTVERGAVNINVMFCMGCGQYFVSIVTLEQFKSIYGGLLAECVIPNDINLREYSWINFAPDTVLSRCGYTVKEGISRSYRQTVLQYILESGKASKYEIIEKINSFISLRENRPQYAGACKRWKEDIQFVNEYMIDSQKKVYGLEFKSARKRT